jgi:integrase/recombinase XerD
MQAAAPPGQARPGQAPQASPGVVARAYLDHLSVERALAANTLRAYRRDLGRYLAALAADGVADLSEVTERRVATYLAGLRQGDGEHPALAPASAARALSAVRGLHRFAFREGLTAEDPASEVAPPAPPRRLPKALDVDQVEAILAAAGADGVLALRDRALLEFLYGTGARISEAIGACVDDLDLAEGTVLLRGKGGRDRLVPVGGYAVAALQAYLVRSRPVLAAAGAAGCGAGGRGASARGTAGRGTPRVFLNARGTPLSRQSAWTILRRAAERAGLGGRQISPHTLRHSYATHLLDGGADVRVVQELLGHASVTTTQVYTLVTVDRLREVYATAHPRAR